MRTLYSALALAACTGLLTPTSDAQGTLIYDPTPRTWADAQANAANMGGNLVAINDADENEAVADLLTANGSSQAWIGFNDRTTEGEFVWSDGSPVTYTNWAPNEPNDSGGDEDCAELINFFPGDTWNDARCSVTRTSVIEISAEDSDVSGSLDYGSCSATLPAGRATCFLQLSGTNNLDDAQRYTLFLRLSNGDGFSRIAKRGEIKLGGGASSSNQFKFRTLASDPAGELTGELLAEAGSVGAPSSAAVVLDELAFTKLGGAALRAAEGLTVFPNPAAGAATLRFVVAEAAEATVGIYDALGREVARPVDGPVEGVVEAQVDASGLAPGLYVARLVADGRTEAVRFSVVR